MTARSGERRSLPLQLIRRATRGDLQLTSLGPNPGNGLIDLRYQNPTGSEDQISLVDGRGVERAVSIERQRQGVEKRVLIDGTDLPSGIYYVMIRSDVEVLVSSHHDCAIDET